MYTVPDLPAYHKGPFVLCFPPIRPAVAVQGSHTLPATRLNGEIVMGDS